MWWGFREGGLQKARASEKERTVSILLPQPTVWPMVLALGITLGVAGIVTHVAVSVLGLLLSVIAAVGWFRQVLPHERHEEVLAPAPAHVAAVRQAPREPLEDLHPQVTPLANFSFIAGIEGGLAGGVAMAIPAIIYSLLKFHSPWYAINLLAAGGFVSWINASDAFLAQFHPQGLLAALAIHTLVSLLMGLLYGALLPIFPRRSILTSGIIIPLLWTGLAYGFMSFVSPILNDRVDWRWFIVSQVAFGLVAGQVVIRRVRMRMPEYRSLPFATRAGLHTDRGPRPRPNKDHGGDQR
jgi:hypothetical protein